MQIFYAPEITGETYVLDEKESKHCIKVLRMMKGNLVKLIDGKGNLYEGIINKPDVKACEINIVNVIKEFEKKVYRLHIAISPLKNPERFEWFIEKSVEIGVDEITPIICKNTEKQGIKKERINNIIISAMKQSLKAELTMLNDKCLLNDFLNKNIHGRKMIAHCNSGLIRSKLYKEYFKGDDAVIMIGPEGDFTENEIISACRAGYKPVDLGKSRLRTETAGIAACHSIYMLNQ